MKKYNLEERLIDFAVLILKVAEALPRNYVGKHLGSQITQSGTSPALNYGEAQGAESPTDFLHKIKICLKELRETQINLKIIKRKPILQGELMTAALNENGQLVAIFTKSVQTAKENIDKNKIKKK